MSVWVLGPVKPCFVCPKLRPGVRGGEWKGIQENANSASPETAGVSCKVCSGRRVPVGKKVGKASEVDGRKGKGQGTTFSKMESLSPVRSRCPSPEKIFLLASLQVNLWVGFERNLSQKLNTICQEY